MKPINSVRHIDGPLRHQVQRDIDGPLRHQEQGLASLGSGLPVRSYYYHIVHDSHCTLVVALSEKQVPISMAIGNEELMQECFPKHWRMGTARMK